MNLNKAQLLLEKINRLYKSMSLDPENVAAIEKDLMRDYIKQLYAAFLEESITKSNQEPTATSRMVHAAPVDTYVPPVVKPKREERIITPLPKTRQHREERTTIAPPPPPVTERIIAPPPVIEEVVASTPPPVYNRPKVMAVPQSSRQQAPNEEYEQLFQQESSNELSHKLGTLPISDLNKAMGINERIFTINELFRGDSGAFKKTIAMLNQLPSFREAKAYLAENVVNEFDWTNKLRRNKAKNFIKLVNRRYL